MPINLADRFRISTFVRKTNSLNNFTGLAYQGGPCAAFVKSIIETSTGKQIFNPTHVFGSFSNQLSLHSRIDSLFQLQALQEGDILCIVDKNIRHNNMNGITPSIVDVRHFMLVVNINDYKIISTNGLFDMRIHQSVAYKGAILTNFLRQAFAINYYDNNGRYRGNVYWYQDMQRECELYKIDYTLIDIFR